MWRCRSQMMAPAFILPLAVTGVGKTVSKNGTQEEAVLWSFQFLCASLGFTVYLRLMKKFPVVSSFIIVSE